MKRKTQPLKLHKETLRGLNTTEGRMVAGGLPSVRADCSDQAWCNSGADSCPGNCLTDNCLSRTFCWPI